MARPKKIPKISVRIFRKTPVEIEYEPGVTTVKEVLHKANITVESDQVIRINPIKKTAAEAPPPPIYVGFDKVLTSQHRSIEVGTLNAFGRMTTSKIDQHINVSR